MARSQGTLFLPPEKTVSEERRLWQANGNHLSPDAAAGLGAYLSHFLAIGLTIFLVIGSTVFT